MAMLNYRKLNMYSAYSLQSKMCLFGSRNSATKKECIEKVMPLLKTMLEFYDCTPWGIKIKFHKKRIPDASKQR